ncbi:hypothetical protein SAMN06269185_2830 [Natronoarchaeum philippinense]|uniref:Polysaccharide deacetylase n=1 Tax=Natronoarchaeum philippinense TaxID=558529 RepID=A0A285P702_NATPI|nr:hypothetical protein [Natronoarchaeum philippinense]SNZ16963.1 hypothetical protein SAMN06269185_2830 [Natronoarchaeum philippinense]
MGTNRDFTFETYGELLDAGLEAGYSFLTVREYLATDAGELPEQFVVLRHDVDRKPENALDMARLEAQKEVPSTYYVRTIEKTFRPGLIRRIEELGHEVGYHYEDLDRADGDVSAAHEFFSAELARLRALVSVDTICMHGNPLTAHDNRDMWADGATATDGGRLASTHPTSSSGGSVGRDDSPPTFETYDLLGEAYLSMDFEDVTYFSDTGRTWRDGELKIKDHTMGQGEKHVQVDTTEELAALLRSGEIDRLCVLSHPNRWARTTTEFAVEWTKDYAVNVAKRGLNAVER